MGFSGNFVGGIWMGNDDYTPTRRMTGGSLPAMTWQKVMAYAHQGIDIKPIPGLKGTPAPSLDSQKVASNPNFNEAPRPVTLPQRTSDQLLRLEKILRETNPSHSSSILEAPSTALASDNEGKSFPRAR
jgi:penicillin-binding protein 1A